MIRNSGTRKLKIFKGFLMSYILILVLPFAFGSFVYYKALEIIEKDAKDARIFMLRQSCAIIDNYLKDMDKAVISMSINTYLSNILHMEQPSYGSSDIYYLTQTQKEMKNYNMSSTFESSYYIFLKKGDMVLTDMDINFGIAQYYSNNFVYSGMEYDEWYEKMLETRHNREITPFSVTANSSFMRISTDYLSYVQSLPISSGNDILGAIIVLIKKDGIDKLLMDVDESGSGYTYILDGNGRLLTGVSGRGSGNLPEIAVDLSGQTGFKQQNINGTDMAVIHIKSQYNGWTYVTALPVTVFMDKALYIKKVILAIVCITFLIGITISIYLTRRNIRPIREMMLTLRKVFKGETGSGRNEYELLKNGVARLVNTHEEMKKSMEYQGILMRSTFISRIIHGEISDEKEISILSGHLGINLEGKKHAAAIIVLNRLTDIVKKELLIEQDINRVIIENVFSKHMGEKCFTYILDADQIALLLNFDTDDDKECERLTEAMLENVRSELLTTFNIVVIFGIGNLYEKISDLNLSFSEAKNTLALFNETNPEKTIIWYKDVNKKLSGYYYPVELEQQLINMAKSGNREDIDRLIEIIYSENFVKRSLTNYMEYNLLFDMRGTIIKIYSDINCDFDLKEIISSKYSTMSIQEVFASMKKAYYQICNEVNNRKRSHNDQLIGSLTDFI